MNLVERLRMKPSITICEEAADRIEAIEAEVLEQCRINGIGAEREAALMGKVERLEAHNAVLREALEFYVPMIRKGESPAEQALASTPEQSLSSIRRAERERCAKVADAHASGWETNPGNNPQAGYIASSNIAAAIRQMEDY